MTDIQIVREVLERHTLTHRQDCQSLEETGPGEWGDSGLPCDCGGVEEKPRALAALARIEAELADRRVEKAWLDRLRGTEWGNALDELLALRAEIARKDAALRDCWGDAYLIAMAEFNPEKGLSSIISTARVALEEKP